MKVEEEYSIPVEDFFAEGTIIMGSEPIPNVTVADIRKELRGITTTEQLVDIYVNVHNKFWYIEDEVYDYDEGSAEYMKIVKIVDEWGALMDEIAENIILKAEEEGVLAPNSEHLGLKKRIEKFMKKYGYRDGMGWWTKFSD